MTDIDKIRNIARETLLVATTEGKIGETFWDHAQRLSRNVEAISHLPQLSGSQANIDTQCLFAATYFLVATLVQQEITIGRKTKTEPLQTKNKTPLDSAAAIVEQKLAGIMEKTRIQKIKKIITESSIRSTKMPEAMILSDARNLDDMGLTGILNEFKQYAGEHKGIEHLFKGWEKKIDYHYWQARLKDDFHFPAVRQLARARLAAAEAFMEQLKLEAQAEDIEQIAAESTQKN